MQIANVRSQIINEKKIAEDNPEHLKTLYKLCQEAGFNTEVYNSPTNLDPGKAATAVKHDFTI
jgi:hypothetical protein